MTHIQYCATHTKLLLYESELDYDNIANCLSTPPSFKLRAFPGCYAMLLMLCNSIIGLYNLSRGRMEVGDNLGNVWGQGICYDGDVWRSVNINFSGCTKVTFHICLIKWLQRYPNASIMASSMLHFKLYLSVLYWSDALYREYWCV